MEPSRAYQAGEVIDGFRLRRCLGAGASGEVWEAEELALGDRLVALKLLRPSLVSDERARERFRRGAIAASRIHHPGIVTVHSFSDAEAQPYIAQELIEGGTTLAALIARQRQSGTMDASWFRRVATLTAEIAEAMAAAHALGILHRDVKPDNVLIDREGHAKVADFGLAHLAGERPLSQTGDVMGTLCYMSPAQVRGDVRQLDEGSDLFSLGATLYELLTLRRAFLGQTLPEITNQILFVDPPLAREVQARVPAHLELIAAKALEKHPADRLRSMTLMAQELRRFLAGEPTQLKPSTVFARALKWGRRHPTASATIGIASVGLVSIAFLWGIWSERVRRVEAEKHAAELEHLHSEASFFVQLGNLEAASERVRAADALEPRDATAHLILASGLMGQARRREAERELEAARARGFEPGASAPLDALAHAGQALWLLFRHDHALYPEVEAHIDAALGLDPSLCSLELSRYHVRLAAEDDQGAEQALARYQAHLPSGSDHYRVLDALRQETRGELRTALATLEALRASLGDGARLAELRWYRNAGRIAVNLGELALAEPYLEHAVVDDPGDCVSWEALAALNLKRYQAGDRRVSVMEAARAYARRANECSPSLATPYRVSLQFSLGELEEGPPRPDMRSCTAWKEARKALDALAALPFPAADLAALEAALLTAEARHPFAQGRYDVAIDLYRQALAHDPGNARCSAQLVQACWSAKDYALGVDVALKAIERLDREADAGQHRESLGTLLGWGLGSAGLEPDDGAFAALRARFLSEFERGTRFAPLDLINAAEFLALAVPELRDCESALMLLDLHDYVEELGGLASVKASIRTIEENCR